MSSTNDPATQEVITTAKAAAFERYHDDVDTEGQAFDDWGYSQCERNAFVAGALFQAERQGGVKA